MVQIYTNGRERQFLVTAKRREPQRSAIIFTREQLPCVNVADSVTAFNSQVLVMMSGHKALLEGRCAGGVLEAAATMTDVDQRITLRGSSTCRSLLCCCGHRPKSRLPVLACVILHWARPLSVAGHSGHDSA